MRDGQGRYGESGCCSGCDVDDATTVITGVNLAEKRRLTYCEGSNVCSFDKWI